MFSSHLNPEQVNSLTPGWLVIMKKMGGALLVGYCMGLSRYMGLAQTLQKGMVYGWTIAITEFLLVENLRAMTCHCAHAVPPFGKTYGDHVMGTFNVDLWLFTYYAY